MILCLDTSSLVKLYVDEAGVAKVKTLAAKADAIVSSTLAYVEAKSAFSRKTREKGITLKNHHRIIERFNKEWEGYYHVEVSSR